MAVEGRTEADTGPSPAPEPARTTAGKPGLRAATVAFRHRNFAIFWPAALVSSTGSQMQAVTVPFVLFKLTHNGAWIGFAVFAQFVPSVLMGPLGGSLADRFPRRRILMVTQSLLAVGALGLWALWAAGVTSPTALVAVVAATGFVAGLNIPAWQAFVSELVPRNVLLNAVTLNSAQFNASRAFGPAVGGVVLATLGPSWGFLLNALSYVAVLVALWFIRVPRLQDAMPVGAGSVRPGVLAEFAATARYMRARAGMVTCVVVVIALGLLGGPLFSLLIVFADDVFHVGDTAYGWLGAALGIGAILGTPLIAGRGSSVRRGPLTGRALFFYGAAIATFGLAPTYVVGFAALLVAGASYLAIASTLNTTLQLQVDEHMRGKVIALYLMGLTVSLPIGSPAQGALVELIGPRATIAGAGLLLVAMALWLRASGRLESMDAAAAVAAAAEPS